MKRRKSVVISLGAVSATVGFPYTSPSFDTLTYDEVICHINVTAGVGPSNIYIAGFDSSTGFIGLVLTPIGGSIGFQVPGSTIAAYTIKLTEPLPRNCVVFIDAVQAGGSITGTLNIELVKGAF